MEHDRFPRAATLSRDGGDVDVRLPTAFARRTWSAIAVDDGCIIERFDPATLAPLPAPARRLLARALPTGAPLHTSIQLEMSGTIRLAGRWWQFRADQLVRAGVGFVWSAVVGGRWIRFVGADALGTDGAHLEFRLHGRVPVASATGPEVMHSAAGRLAAETVAWLPQTLAPQAGAHWSGIDDSRASVTIKGPGRPVDIVVEVDARGDLRTLQLERWNTAKKPHGPELFGSATNEKFTTSDGVVISGDGTVGWGWGTPARRDFFTYRIRSATSM